MLSNSSDLLCSQFFTISLIWDSICGWIQLNSKSNPTIKSFNFLLGILTSTTMQTIVLTIWFWSLKLIGDAIGAYRLGLKVGNSSVNKTVRPGLLPHYKYKL